MTAHTHPRTLWKYLWVWSLLALGFSWLTLVVVAYFTGLHEADEITDGQLASSVQLLLRQTQAPLQVGNQVVCLPGGRAAGDPDNYAPELHVVIWEGEQLVCDTHGLASALADLPGPAAQDLRLVYKGQTQVWRALMGSGNNPAGVPRRVLVLIDKDRREALGRDFAWHIVQPAMVLLPLVALLLLWAIRRGLQPLEQLAAEVAQLDLDAGDTLQSQQPFAELSGTVKAINSLAQRLQAQVLRERSFASDVAHELRTPLTAQVLQARLAREQCSNEQRDAALQQVEQNALRAGRILAQLMDLTRAQALDQQTPQRLDLNAMCHQLVAEHVPLAHQLGHDLALDVPAEPVWVHGHGLMLELALRNLIDNAIRHTSSGTQVEVSVKRLGGKAVCLSVSDDGETGGLDQSAGSGMGIGLTLVRRIASWHGIALEQCVGVAPFTKSFTLTWPDAEVMRATGLADPA